MPKNKSVLLAILVLILSVLACSTADMITEKTTVTILSPTRDFRITDEVAAEGEPQKTNLSVQLDTNRKVDSIVANVILNNTAPVPCTLVPNKLTDCGLLPIYNKGQQTVRVEVVGLNGQIISDEVPFLWEPYIGFDKTALKFSQLLGSNNPTLGSYLMGVLGLAIFAVAFAAFAKTSQSMVFGIISSILIFIGLFIYYKPEVAANLFLALIGVISTGVVATVIIYALSKGYSISTGKQHDILIEDRFTGLRMQDKSKTGAFFGPNQSSNEQDLFQAFLQLNQSLNRSTPLQGFNQAQLPYEEQAQQTQVLLPAPVQKPVRFGDWLWAGFKSKVKK